MPLTRNVIVDREAALTLIDELRSAVPEEVRAAKRISHDRDKIMEQSQEEAEQIVARAQEQAAYLISERGLTEEALAQSDQIVARAQADAAATRNGADEYASSVLNELASEVDRTLVAIEGGMHLLEERRAAYAASLAPAPQPTPAAAADADLHDDEGPTSGYPNPQRADAKADPRYDDWDRDGRGRR
jgi:hypothetical protein